MTVVKKNIFVSSDLSRFEILSDFMICQSRFPDSTFEVTGHSSKRMESDGVWERVTRAAINQADVLVVMLGPKTRYSMRVEKEVAMARDLSKATVQIIGYSDGSPDWGLIDAGPIYRWDWDTIKEVLA
jgi:hypothetical protein